MAKQLTAPTLTPAQSVARLREQILEADAAYYGGGQTKMSDAAYDKLVAMLRSLEDAHPDLRTPESPTMRVSGGVTKGFEARNHLSPMLSIDNAFDEESVVKWVKNWQHALGCGDAKLITNIIVEPKIDGAAVNLIYEHGVLAHAISRGTGLHGDDITANIRTIRAIPLQLYKPEPWLAGQFEVRGEVFIRTAEFNQLCQEAIADNKKLPANARNLAAGTLRLHDPSEVAKRHLSFLAHGFGKLPTADYAYARQVRAAMTASGIPWVEEFPAANLETIEQLLAYLAALRQGAASGAPPTDYDIDGWVLKVDHLATRAALGKTDKYPHWAVAVKMETYTATTKLLDVTWQVGRSGVLTPVAALEPVMLAGTEVSAASLHNAQLIAQKDLRIGDTVEVQKAGKIIPQVSGVVTRGAGAKTIKTPTTCPECKSALGTDTNADGTESVAIYCLGADCPAKLIGSVLHFASRELVDIDQLGEELVAELVKAKLITSLPDIYRLREKKAAVIGKTRLASRGCEKLLAAIEASKDVEYWRVLAGLGIRRLGKTYSKQVMQLCATPYDAMFLTASDLADKIPPSVIKTLLDFSQVPKNREMVRMLGDLGVGTPAIPQAVESTKLLGLTVVVTGALKSGTREQIHEKITAHGGTVQKDVSKTTKLLVCGENAGSKLAKAERLGVSVKSEAEFLKMLE